ncbi:MAG: EF-hand domain-containing protein [Actinomycetota bacterium]|nr:EF-hand domain-containing protein [Actinomycetota bacterium]
MASEFQRRKIAGVFSAMDADDDGFLDESDFTALTTRWTGIRGAAPGSDDHTRLTAIMMGWWQTLLASSDLDRDAKVTLDEVLVVTDQLGNMADAVTATAQNMFDAIDENRDNTISASEYRRLIEAWNGTDTDTDETFPLLDLDHDGLISRDEFTELWTQFWVSDDPRLPGTWVFGRFDLAGSAAT